MTGVLPGCRRQAGRTPSLQGYALLELLFVVCVAALAVAVFTPSFMAERDVLRARAAARYLSARAGAARAEAVGRGAAVALRFVDAPGAPLLETYVDGNGDGVLTADILTGLDPPISRPVSLASLFPGVRIGFQGGRTPLEPPVPGRARLLSFSPRGSATAATVYVHGTGGVQWAVRVLGVTGRVRVLRYLSGDDEWTELE